MKRIITLTTDFGYEDHYTGSMKGVILGINDSVAIVDITHKIPRHNIFKAAYTVANFYKYFPENAVHVVVVDPGVGSNRRPIVIETDHGVFIGPDNGVFSLVINSSGRYEIYELTNDKYMLDNVSNTFHGRDIFAPAAAHISAGVEPKILGNVVLDPVRRRIKQPLVSDAEIVGEVIYADSFGNLITNIDENMVIGCSKIVIGNIIIDTVAKSYDDAETGEVLALIGSSGFLEIAVNQGSAANSIKDIKVTVRF